MGEPAVKIEESKVVADEGLNRGMERLTPEKIEKVIQSVLKSETGSRLKVYVDTCVHCGLCSEACHFYLSNEKNPSFSPAGKVKQTLWEMLKQKGKVSPEFIRRASEIASTECNLCRRCSMYCPFGIDIAYLMLVVRRICHKLGVTPQYIQSTAHSHSATMNQMWVKEDEWIDSLMWQEEEAREEFPNLRIPLDKEGADIFYSVIAPEPKFRAQLIYQAAAIMHKAGLDWTMPSTPGWDNSDMCMYTGDEEMVARLKKKHYETALRLKVKRIVAWLIATLPTLFIAIAGFGGFLDFMRTAGGGIAILIAVLFLPAYHGYRKTRSGCSILPRLVDRAWASWFVALAYVAMAIGSIVTIG